MLAFAYQAALYCVPCATAIKTRLHADLGACFSHEDSDSYPQGPYSRAGGEADSPQHCDACHVFLENPLTDDGVAYVADLLDQHKASGRGSHDVLAAWAAEYALDWPAIRDAAERAGFA